MKKLRLHLSHLVIVNLIFEVFFSRKKISYSTFGEDILLEGLLNRYEFISGNKLEFSYLDIGAWKPKSASNTYILYKKGYRGTVVEANHYLHTFWKILRPKDLFMNVACSNDKSVDLLLFHPTAESNTIDQNFANKISDAQKVNVSKIQMVKGLSLQEIVQSHKSTFREDFILDLDIEGKDFEVLGTYNFEDNPRPVIILVEDVPETKEDVFTQSDIHKYLSNAKYSLVGRSAITSIYVDLDHSVSSILSY
jgi:hypothetical protein